jgi:hypothetical protein
MISGCSLKNIIDNIGYDNIAQLADSDELLKQFSTSVLVDHICNDNDRDIHQIIKELFDSGIELNSENEVSLNKALADLLLKTTG